MTTEAEVEMFFEIQEEFNKYRSDIGYANTFPSGKEEFMQFLKEWELSL